jgi:hypothetical protein
MNCYRDALIALAEGLMSETDPRVVEANLQKAEAEARAAQAAARKAETEADALDSTTAKHARDAQNMQAAAEAEQKAAAARQQQLAALIPDLSKTKDSTLDVAKEGPALRGSALTFGALEEAAKAIASQLSPSTGGWRLLVTSEQDLATPDATYHEVIQGFLQLIKAAETILGEPAPGRAAFAPLPEMGALVATAVPQVLSLLSAERSLVSSAVTVTDLAAAAAVSGALQVMHGDKVGVMHDDFRLMVPGMVYEKSDEVATKRQELIARKISLSESKAQLESQLVEAKSQEQQAAKALTDAEESKSVSQDLIPRQRSA